MSTNKNKISNHNESDLIDLTKIKVELIKGETICIND